LILPILIQYGVRHRSFAVEILVTCSWNLFRSKPYKIEKTIVKISKTKPIQLKNTERNRNGRFDSESIIVEKCKFLFLLFDLYI